MLALAVLGLAACGNGNVIGSGPTPSPAPVTPNVSFEYSIPTANSGPWGIVTGVDGYLYFTENAASKIGKLSTGGTFTELPTTTGAAAPQAIVSGPDNALWFTENAARKIGTVTTAFKSTTLTEYTIPAAFANAKPAYITRGVPQNSLYFTDPGDNAIGEILVGGTFAGPFTIPTANSNPQGIATGPDGKMWFTESSAGKIGMLNPAGNAITEFALPNPAANPTSIVLAQDGAMWFSENIAGAPKLGRLTPSLVYSDFSLTGAQSATNLVLDSFGDIVVADPTGKGIGIFSFSGQTYKEYTAPNAPFFPTLGPEGKIYFTENAAGKIGQFSYF